MEDDLNPIFQDKYAYARALKSVPISVNLKKIDGRNAQDFLSQVQEPEPHEDSEELAEEIALQHKKRTGSPNRAENPPDSVKTKTIPKNYHTTTSGKKSSAKERRDQSQENVDPNVRNMNPFVSSSSSKWNKSTRKK
jgi:hypothetical protein